MTNSQADLDSQVLDELRQKHLGRLLLRAYRAFSSTAVEKLKTRGYSGITSAHSMLLMSIDVDGSQMTRLGEKIGVSRQAVAKLVQNLEAGGYVQKSPDKSDKRASIVSLTDNGWKLIKNIVEIKSEIEQEYCSVIGEEQMQQLRSNLNRLLNTFE